MTKTSPFLTYELEKPTPGETQKESFPGLKSPRAKATACLADQPKALLQGTAYARGRILCCGTDLCVGFILNASDSKSPAQL